MKNIVYALIFLYMPYSAYTAEDTSSQSSVKVPRLALGGLSHVRQRSKSDSQVSSVPVHIVISPRKKDTTSHPRKHGKKEAVNVSQDTYIDLKLCKDRESLLAYQAAMLIELKKLKEKKEHWEWHVADVEKELASLETRRQVEHSVKHNPDASKEQKGQAKAFLRDFHDLAQAELKRKTMFRGFLEHEQIAQKIIDKEAILKQLELLLEKSKEA